MALMKNHTFGFNIEDPEQKEADVWCDTMKKRKQLSSYVRDLILADLRQKKNPDQGIRIDLKSRPLIKNQQA